MATDNWIDFSKDNFVENLNEKLSEYNIEAYEKNNHIIINKTVCLNITIENINLIISKYFLKLIEVSKNIYLLTELPTGEIFQYKIIDNGDGSKDGNPDGAQDLSYLGSFGWELTAISGSNGGYGGKRFYFKRKI